MGCDPTCLKAQLRNLPAVDLTQSDDNRFNVSIDATAPDETKEKLHNIVKATTGMVWHERTGSTLSYTIIFADPVEVPAH